MMFLDDLDGEYYDSIPPVTNISEVIEKIRNIDVLNGEELPIWEELTVEEVESITFMIREVWKPNCTDNYISDCLNGWNICGKMVPISDNEY